jgi:signal transduction histidine kinase
MPDTNPIKILLIEDEQDVRESYLDMLSFMGFAVDTAENGLDGLEKLNKANYEIVVTDLNMPVMDGLETLRRIKMKSSSIEVIVITGFATIENAISAMKQGAFDYFTKPVSMEHVRIVLNKCIQKINARRENQQLRDLNTQLTELNDLKSKFITITNHELRTPLAVLKGYLDLLGMELNGSAGPEVKEYYSILSTTLNEMIDMIENMHDLSNYGKIFTLKNRMVFDANELASEIYREVKALFDKRNIKLALKTSGDEAQISAEKTMIKRVLRELVQNALKFTGEDGQVVITVKNIKLKNQVFIMVSDTGIGIPHDKIALIFEPFYEVQDVMHHSTSKTDFMGGGIGVGLSYVREIVAAHNGEVVVESALGKGSTFTLILPLSYSRNNEPL